MAGYVLLGVLAAAGVLLAALFVLSGNGKAVQVTVDGRVIATLPLDVDTEQVITGVGDSQNRLIIRDGKVTVTDASCPDGICVSHGAISRPGQSIVCLPNRVVVTVTGGAPAVDGEV